MRSPNEELARIQQHLANNELDSAIERLTLLAGRFPNQTVLRSKLAELYGQTEKFELSIQSYLTLIQLKRNEPNSYFNLAIQYKNVGKFDEAIAAYEKALALNISAPEELYLNMGVLYSTHLQQNQNAIECLEKSIAINPNFIPAFMNLANLHEETGDVVQAKQLYQRVLDIDPGFYEALARLANAQRITDENNPILSQITEAFARPTTNAFDRVCLHYAHGKALDSLGKYSGAFAQYKLANQLETEISLPYNPNETEKLFESIIAAFPVKIPSNSNAEDCVEPIFICGMFRSGSTLNEQVLAGHPDIAPGGELDFFPRLVRQVLTPFPAATNGISVDRLAGFGAQYVEYVSKLHPTAKFLTDKRPDNFLYLGLIKAVFPRAKILHTVRNPLDTCLSIYFTQLGDQQSYARRLEDIAHYYGQYLRLMAHWKSIFGDDIHEVSYDAFVTDSVKTSREFFSFLGLTWDEKYLNFHLNKNPVKTASFEQVRQPLYGRSSGRWKNYEQELERFKALFSFS